MSKVVVRGVGALAKLWCSYLNSCRVVNADTLLRHVRRREGGVGLVTVSNHMSTMDDPLLWGFRGFPSCDPALARWVLAAHDICFTNAVLSRFFRLGKCIPIVRDGGGIYQAHMEKALEKLRGGEWVHTFPQGNQDESTPIGRLKWGTASLIARCHVTPVVLPIHHHGFHKVMPESFLFGRRPPIPLCNMITIVVGDPIRFDLPSMRDSAVSSSRRFSQPLPGWPTTPDGLDEAAQRCLYSAMSEVIQAAMENLRTTSLAVAGDS